MIYNTTNTPITGESMHEEIKRYYLDNISSLPVSKGFHFASRLYLWNQDHSAKQITLDLKPSMLQNKTPEATVAHLRAISAGAGGHESVNAKQIRAEYTEKYSFLRRVMPMLYYMHWSNVIYGEPIDHLFDEVLDRSEAESLMEQLLNDPRGTAVLSTHAVNFFYLYSHYIKKSEASEHIAYITDIYERSYDDNVLIELQLKLYLVTHAIIGETLFYSRGIRPDLIPIYTDLCRSLDKLITDRFIDINLDNKLEFLVCSKICGYEPSSKDRVNQEAEASISKNGTFLVDQHNNNPQLLHDSLKGAEHKSVLYIMSGSSFTPLS